MCMLIERHLGFRVENVNRWKYPNAKQQAFTNKQFRMCACNAHWLHHQHRKLSTATTITSNTTTHNHSPRKLEANFPSAKHLVYLSAYLLAATFSKTNCNLKFIFLKFSSSFPSSPAVCFRQKLYSSTRLGVTQFGNFSKWWFRKNVQLSLERPEASSTHAPSHWSARWVEQSIWTPLLFSEMEMTVATKIIKRLSFPRVKGKTFCELFSCMFHDWRNGVFAKFKLQQVICRRKFSPGTF